MKRRIQAADSIRFCVRGRGAQRLLGQAAQAGLKLERIVPQADGFTAVVSGADGLLIEVHNDPMHAQCDGAQSLTPDQFDAVAKQVLRIREVIGA